MPGDAILRPDGAPGPGSDAIIELDPTSPPYHDAVAGNPPTDRDLCAGLVHELVHVADIWNGAWDLTSVEPLDWVDPETGSIVSTDGSGILRRELQAMQEENCYRVRNGLAPRRIYPWQQPDSSIRLFLLPVDAIFPPYCSS